jgi:hypothetical protein
MVLRAGCVCCHLSSNSRILRFEREDHREGQNEEKKILLKKMELQGVLFFLL